MYVLKTSTLGIMETPERQNEYSLILGAVDAALRNRGDWLAAVTSWFKPEYIADPYFHKIWLAVVDLFEANEPITDHTLAARLPLDGTVFGTRAAEFHGVITDCTSYGGHLPYYASRVYDTHRRAAASDDIAGAAADMARTHNPDDVLAELPAITTRYAPAPQNRIRDNATILQEVRDKRAGKVPESHVRFGIRPLDDLVTLAPSKLLTIAAGTSGGKSVLLGQTAIRCADYHDLPALFFTFEMNQAEMYERWAALLSRQPIKGGDDQQFDAALERVDRLTKDGRLHLFTTAHHVEDISATAAAYAATNRLGLICVDYLQLVPPSHTRNVTRERQVSHVVNSLKTLAMQIGVPILTATQLNKQGDPRESEDIKNASDVYIKLKSEQAPGQANLDMDLYIEKNRNGATDVVYVTWERPLFTIREKDAYDAPNFDHALADDYDLETLDSRLATRRRENGYGYDDEFPE